jgi:hypothetical protein
MVPWRALFRAAPYDITSREVGASAFVVVEAAVAVDEARVREYWGFVESKVKVLLYALEAASHSLLAGRFFPRGLAGAAVCAAAADEVFVDPDGVPLDRRRFWVMAVCPMRAADPTDDATVAAATAAATREFYFATIAADAHPSAFVRTAAMLPPRVSLVVPAPHAPSLDGIAAASRLHPAHSPRLIQLLLRSCACRYSYSLAAPARDLRDTSVQEKALRSI